MTDSNLFSTLKNKFPAITEEANTQNIIVPAENIQEICLFLKENLDFDYLINLSAVDYKDKLVLIYHFYSFKAKNLPALPAGKICLKVFLNRDNPKVKSISNFWPAANWHEREAYDLMGIVFVDHPDLRRILLPDNWIGHPLRKDYEKQDIVRMPQV